LSAPADGQQPADFVGELLHHKDVMPGWRPKSSFCEAARPPPARSFAPSMAKAKTPGRRFSKDSKITED